MIMKHFLLLLFVVLTYQAKAVMPISKSLNFLLNLSIRNRNELRFYQTNALCSLGMNILSVDWMLKASYQLSIIGRAAFTRERLGE